MPRRGVSGAGGVESSTRDDDGVRRRRRLRTQGVELDVGAGSSLQPSLLTGIWFQAGTCPSASDPSAGATTGVGNLPTEAGPRERRATPTTPRMTS
jgi:hypothetical protein